MRVAAAFLPAATRFVDFRRAVDLFAVDFRRAGFRAVDFLAVDFLLAGFRAVDFLAVDFLLAGLRAAVFFAAVFLRAGLRAADLFAVDRFRAAVFFAAIPVPLSLSWGLRSRCSRSLFEPPDPRGYEGPWVTTPSV